MNVEPSPSCVCHKRLSLAVLLAAGVCGCEEKSTSRFDLLTTPVGDVNFLSSCEPAAAGLIERGVGLLHHMMYAEASFVFNMADDRDPDCALAYWGQAMAIINPLWPNVPSAEDFERGQYFVRRSTEVGAKDNRELGYLATTKAYFELGHSAKEQDRLRAFARAWATVAEENSDDSDAIAFSVLARLAVADPSDASLSAQRQAGRLAEQLLARSPNHPGAHHYLIHAYDYPALAKNALAVADHYGEITPSVPHATHMMTHVYTRLGLWDKAIEWNRASAETAWALCVENGEINSHYTHALDYLAYAYLQLGKDDEAGELLETLEQLKPPYEAGNQHASAYAFAAIPARIALERRDWQAATQLAPASPKSFAWRSEYAPYVAITHFARALGWARLGEPTKAAEDLAALARIHDATENPYWAKQVAIQRLIAVAWQRFAGGDEAGGLAQMRDAVELSQTTEKHAITPGEVLPAAELYGDMLLAAGHHSEALDAYMGSLQRSPRRLVSLANGVIAATELGDAQRAGELAAELAVLAAGSDRPLVRTARRAAGKL